MSLIEDYISQLKNNKFAYGSKESKQTFLKYCIETNTIGYFFNKSAKEFEDSMDSLNWKESIIFAQKKSLQHQSSLKHFLKLTETNNVDICLLKGAFMSNFIYQNFTMRSMRDIDVLVDEDDFLKIVNIMLANGFVFLNSRKDKLNKFDFKYAHQAPILVDRFGIAFEIHHRLKTQPELKNSDFLTENLINHKKEKILFDTSVSIPTDNFAFIHCCYHAINKSKLSIGPIFLNDLMEFKNRINDEILEDARKSNCLKETELGIEILNYINDLNMPIKKQVKQAIEIIVHCYKMPEFMPRKKINLLSSLKKSYAFNSYVFSLGDLSTYIKLKTKQIVIFLKSYLFNFSLHKKRSRFFKDFKKLGL